MDGELHLWPFHSSFPHGWTTTMEVGFLFGTCMFVVGVGSFGNATRKSFDSKVPGEVWRQR
jgi:hypothetical protein